MPTLRTVGERLMWRQADTAARDLLTASAVAAPGLPTAADLMRPGGDYVLDSPALPVPVWGEAERVVMAEGESLMLLGRAGSGKTTRLGALLGRWSALEAQHPHQGERRWYGSRGRGATGSPAVMAVRRPVRLP